MAESKGEVGTAFVCVHEIISIVQMANALRENPSLKSCLFNSEHSHASKIIFTVILCTYFQEMYVMIQ